MNNSTFPAPSVISAPTSIIDGISIYDRKDYNQWFETEYSTTAEPWEYSNRAAELYRQLYTVQHIRRYQPAPEALLELGCSRGLMTQSLIPFSHGIYAADISLTAVKACKQHCSEIAVKHHCRMKYFVATAPGLPFTADSFDVVTVCDGLDGWWFSDEQKRLALQDIYRVLKPGGIAVLTDYVMPKPDQDKFQVYEAAIRKSPLPIIEIDYLYDKPWYKLESVLQKSSLKNKFNSVLSSIPVAKTLNSIGRLFGRRAACHMIVIVRKE